MRALGVAILASAAAACSPVEMTRRAATEFGDGVVAGTLRGGNMREVSGMVSSLSHPGHYWLHNDSGSQPELILIDSTGLEKARVLVQGARNRDWEDISRRGDTLLIAETGDNDAKHDTIYVYAVLEPKTISSEPLPALAVYPMQFPDGPRDAEALMVDPTSGSWFLITKRENTARVYRYEAPQRPGTLAILEKLPVELPFRLVVAADMSADGREFLIKTYDAIYLFQRAGTEPVTAALQRIPVRQPYVPERQGEAIAYTLDGSAYYTASEIELEDPQLLLRYRRRVTNTP